MGKLFLGIIFGGLALFVYQRAQHPGPRSLRKAVVRQSLIPKVLESSS